MEIRCTTESPIVATTSHQTTAARPPQKGSRPRRLTACANATTRKVASKSRWAPPDQHQHQVEDPRPDEGGDHDPDRAHDQLSDGPAPGAVELEQPVELGGAARLHREAGEARGDDAVEHQVVDRGGHEAQVAEDERVEQGPPHSARDRHGLEELAAGAAARPGSSPRGRSRSRSGRGDPRPFRPRRAARTRARAEGRRAAGLPGGGNGGSKLTAIYYPLHAQGHGRDGRSRRTPRPPVPHRRRAPALRPPARRDPGLRRVHPGLDTEGRPAHEPRRGRRTPSARTRPGGPAPRGRAPRGPRRADGLFRVPRILG